MSGGWGVTGVTHLTNELLDGSVSSFPSHWLHLSPPPMAGIFDTPQKEMRRRFDFWPGAICP